MKLLLVYAFLAQHIFLCLAINIDAQPGIQVYEDEPTESTNIIFIGDWGGSATSATTSSQLAVAEQMLKYAYHNHVSFVVSLGDNFYPKGVESSNDIRFKTTFENVYLKRNLTDTPWIITLGNSDHRYDNGKYQIEYGKMSKVWLGQAFYYDISVIFRTPDDGTMYNAITIVIDTTLLCNLRDDRYSDDIEYIHFKWLEEKLNESARQGHAFIFVVGHHPIFSAMSSRTQSNCMLEKVNPLLMKYKVTAYFSGHDHSLQHNYYYDPLLSHGMHYFISGAGADTYKLPVRRYLPKNATNIFYSSDTPGFMTLSLHSDYFNYEFRDMHGNVIKNEQIYANNFTYYNSLGYNYYNKNYSYNYYPHKGLVLALLAVIFAFYICN